MEIATAFIFILGHGSRGAKAPPRPRFFHLDLILAAGIVGLSLSYLHLATTARFRYLSCTESRTPYERRLFKIYSAGSKAAFPGFHEFCEFDQSHHSQEKVEKG